MSASTARNLLEALERTGPRPALAWYGESARIELSGHVLANWMIKAIGHLHDEIALEPGASVVLDLPPHWKRTVLAVAAWSLGAQVLASEPARAGERLAVAPAGEPDVLITDRPGEGPVPDAGEVLALEAVSLAPRFAGDLPALVHDWAQEVRAHPDRLQVPLPAWTGPAPAADDETRVQAPSSGSVPPRLLVQQDGLDEADQVLSVWLRGGGIAGPTALMSARQLADEQPH